MRCRLRITLNGFGRDELAAERFLDSFAETHPEVGPVVSQNTEADTLTVVFSMEATDLHDALDRGRPIFLAGATASGLEAPETLEINASQTPQPELGDRPRELQPA